MNTVNKNALLLLRLGVAFAFLYPAISSLVDPTSWIGYVPSWVTVIMPRETFLPLFSVFEILVACGTLFLGSMLPPILAGATLLSIVAFNPSEFPVTFRDVAIACMAFALALILKK